MRIYQTEHVWSLAPSSSSTGRCGILATSAGLLTQRYYNNGVCTFSKIITMHFSYCSQRVVQITTRSCMSFVCVALLACGPCVFVSIAEVHVGKPGLGVTGAEGGGGALPQARPGWYGECGICGAHARGHLHLPLAPGTLRCAVWPPSVVQHRSSPQHRPETQLSLQQSICESCISF